MIKWDATIPVDSTKWTFVSEHKDKLTKFGKTAHLGYIQSALASYDVETIHLMKQPSRKNAFGLLYISISRDGRELALCEIGGQDRVLMPLTLNAQEKRLFGAFLTSFLAVRYQH